MTGEDDGSPKMDPPQIFVERTLAIVKPDALNKAEEIEDIILRSGFTILQVSVAHYLLLRLFEHAVSGTKFLKCRFI